jgi:hypothetical protein
MANTMDPIAARIIPLAGDQLGVTYEFPGGKHEAHAIAADDLPILRRLKWAGGLSYSNDRVCELAAKHYAL